MECVAYDIQSLFEATLAEDKTSIVLELGKKKLSESITNIHLPPGLYLFSGGSTGLGKSYFQQQRVLKNEAYACFSLLSIRAQQKIDLIKKAMALGTPADEAEKFAEDVLVKLESVNIAISAAENKKIKEFHFDEIQVTYEAGLYRISIETLVETLRKLATLIPVYCYSATYIPEFCMFDGGFDFTFNLRNDFRREMSVFPVISKEQQDANDFLAENPDVKLTDYIKGVKLQTSTQVVNTIERMLIDTRLRQVFFLNNEELAEQAAEQLKAKGISVEVVTADRLKSKKNKAPQATNIMETSEFKNYTVTKKKSKKNIYGDFEEYVQESEGVDVILTTITMEAGININNKVAIGCIQQAPEKIFQQFGRARNDGAWYVIVGQGNKVVKKQRVERISKEHSVAIKKCAFVDDRMASCADGFSEYDRKCQLSCSADYVVSELDKLGYTPVYKDVTLNETIRNARSSAKKFKDQMLKIQETGATFCAKKVAEKLTCSVLKVKHYKEVYDRFNEFFTKDVKRDFDSVNIVFDTLAFGKIELFVKMLENREDYISVTKKIVELREIYFRKESEKEDSAAKGNSDKAVASLNQIFWKDVFHIETAWQEQQINYKSYLQLFKLLIGMEHNGTRWIMRPEKAFWDVPLEGREHDVWNRVNKATDKFGLTGADICVETNLNRKELINTHKVPAIKKIAKSMLERYTPEEQQSIREQNINSMKF